MIALTDSTGNAVQRYDYDSFGNITYMQDPNFIQPYTYTAREYEPETGLHYYRARYYDAEVGRFITEDPIGLAGGINLYVYTDNNPVNFTDPLGLFSSGDAIAGGYLMGIGKGAGECAAALAEMGALARQVRSGAIGDKRGHCLAHCNVRKACGKGLGDALSWGIGYGKEAYDWGYGKILGGRDWAPADIDANEQGRTCPNEKSCEEQCKNLWR